MNLPAKPRAEWRWLVSELMDRENQPIHRALHVPGESPLLLWLRTPLYLSPRLRNRLYLSPTLRNRLYLNQRTPQMSTILPLWCLVDLLK